MDILDEVVENADAAEPVNGVVAQKGQGLFHGCNYLGLRVKALVDDPVGLAVYGGDILSEYLPVRRVLRLLRDDLLQEHLVVYSADVLAAPERDLLPGQQLEVSVHKADETVAPALFVRLLFQYVQGFVYFLAAAVDALDLIGQDYLVYEAFFEYWSFATPGSRELSADTTLSSFTIS